MLNFFRFPLLRTSCQNSQNGDATDDNTFNIRAREGTVTILDDEVAKYTLQTDACQTRISRYRDEHTSFLKIIELESFQLLLYIRLYKKSSYVNRVLKISLSVY